MTTRTRCRTSAGNDAETFGAQMVTDNVASTDASLSGLTLSGATLTPEFHTDSLSYRATVANSVDTTTVSATTSHDSATVAYLDGSDQALEDADGDTGGFQVALAEGPNTIKAKVTAEDETTEETYTAVVTRTGTLALAVDPIAGDDAVNIAEKAAGFEVTGNTGTESGASVSVTIGSGSPLSATSGADGTWSVSVPADASYISGTSVSVTVSASKTGFGTPGDVTRTLAVDLTAPTFQSGEVSADGTQIELTFSETLSEALAPGSAFAVTVAGSDPGIYSLSASGTSVTLILRSAVGSGQAVTVGYTDPSEDDDADAIEDAAGNDAATFDAATVTNNSTVPAIYPARGDTIWANALTVGIEIFSLGQDEFSWSGYLEPDPNVPDGLGRLSGSDKFSYGGTSYTVYGLARSLHKQNNVVQGDNLDLILSTSFPAAPDDLLILNLDGTQLLIDEAAANGATYTWSNPGLTWTDGQPVAAKLIAIPPPKVALISVVDAPSDNLYAIGDTIDLAVTFTKDVTLDTNGGTPQLELTVGDSTRTATCGAATGTTLTCLYVVAEGIEGAINVAANKLTLNGGALTGPNGLSVDTAYTADEVDIDADLRVDAVRPTFVSAATSADGTKIVLAFSEALLEGSAATRPRPRASR